MTNVFTPARGSNKGEKKKRKGKQKEHLPKGIKNEKKEQKREKEGVRAKARRENAFFFVHAMG